MLRTVNAWHYEEGRWMQRPEAVAEEYPLTVWVEDRELLTLLCSPRDLDHLAAGFLVSEGILRRREDLAALTVDADKGHCWVRLRDPEALGLALHGRRTQTAGCAKGMIFYRVSDTLPLPAPDPDLRVSMRVLGDLMTRFNRSSPLFQETGGVHSCALATAEGLLWLQEDIGRHNALDKLIGRAFLESVPLGDKLLLTSGRVSSEILLKCARTGIPAVFSRSAPTALAVAEAERLGLTLGGFLRGGRGNIYTGRERIL